MNRKHASAVLVAAALSAPAGYAIAHHGMISTPSPAITEDSPGWDCTTMGNRVCGDWDFANNPDDRLSGATVHFRRVANSFRAAIEPVWMADYSVDHAWFTDRASDGHRSVEFADGQ